MNRTFKDYQHMFETGQFDSRLCSMYGTSHPYEPRRRYLDLLKQAEKKFGNGNACLLNTCGRAELGGNHTDHNHGNVMAAGIHLDILAAAHATDDMMVTLFSENFPEIRIDLKDLTPRKEELGKPGSIVRGIAAGIEQKGFNICGFSACLTSSVPVGSGLSSSAAFEILICKLFNHLANHQQISLLEMAELSGDAENIYFGKPCGLMDQIACAFNGILQIDFEKPDAPEINLVDFNFEASGYQLAIVKTGTDHAGLTMEYAAIPEEMKAAANCLGQDWARGLTVEELFNRSRQIREQAGDRAFLRLYHFIVESHRASHQAEALLQGDIESFLKLVKESGNSSYKFLQNCVSTLDPSSQPIPVALAMSESFLGDRGACRVHGGGFAGTIQSFVPVDTFPEYQTLMDDCFGKGSVIPLHIRKPRYDYFAI